MSEKENSGMSEAAEREKEISAAETGNTVAAEETLLPPDKEYIKRMTAFRKYYTKLLCIAIAIESLAIVLAVLYDVLVGFSTAIFGAVMYLVFVTSEMYRELGIDYRSIAGGISVKKCRVRYGGTLFVPSRLIGLDVTEIEDRAFGASPKNKELERIFLPATLKRIGKNIFDGCDALSELHFEGTKEEWERIESRTNTLSYTIIFGAEYPPIPKKEKDRKKKKHDNK